MTDPTRPGIAHPILEELLPDPAARARFEETSAALEAAALVRRMRRHALSASGTRGISQTELARRVGLTPPRISQIERGDGRQGPTYALIRRIAHACGIDWTRLVRCGLAQLAAEAETPADPAAAPHPAEPREWPAQPAEVLFAREAPVPWDAPVPQPGKAVG